MDNRRLIQRRRFVRKRIKSIKKGVYPIKKPTKSSNIHLIITDEIMDKMPKSSKTFIERGVLQIALEKVREIVH